MYEHFDNKWTATIVPDYLLFQYWHYLIRANSKYISKQYRGLCKNGFVICTALNALVFSGLRNIDPLISWIIMPFNLVSGWVYKRVNKWVNEGGGRISLWVTVGRDDSDNQVFIGFRNHANQTTLLIELCPVAHTLGPDTFLIKRIGTSWTISHNYEPIRLGGQVSHCCLGGVYKKHVWALNCGNA